MKTILFLTLCPCLLLAAEDAVPQKAAQPPVNPRIDYAGFAAEVQKLDPVRAANRVSEEDFIHMMAEPKTVVLDARSKERFDEMHVKGALHLDFTDFNAPALEKLIPDKGTRVLIYCNNNFQGAVKAFPAKVATVALNAQTFVNLHAYGYTNVKELAPLIEISKVKIPMEGTLVGK